MKRTFFIISFSLCFVSFVTAQIKTREKNIEIVKEKFTPYDSLTNFTGKDAYKYIGQTFYIPVINDKRGYAGFYTKPMTGASYTYKRDKSNSTYMYTFSSALALEGKYFNVLDTIRDKYGTPFLKIKEKESGDIIYYNYYTVRPYAEKIPFIAVGYYEKQKQLLMGKVFYEMKQGWNRAYETGDSPFEKWEVIDYQIATDRRRQSEFEIFWGEELVLQDKSKNTKTVTREDAERTMEYALLTDKAYSTHKKYGSLRIGISKEACEAICGKPDKINTTTGSWGVHEQWVYKDKYIYFENGLVTAIQEEE